ncbi:MAG: hypothetical protein V3T30_07450, partial [Thermodesulfobacteriota bacterium]
MVNHSMMRVYSFLLSLKSRFVIPALCVAVVAVLTSCATIVSSPEGTTTTYVEKSNVLVYAPRAARAQKVVFDTEDKQMIQKPDTPFRQFFDSHSKDFKDGKLDYAKTTILESIVDRLRNREFIEPMIREVVERHKDLVIKPIYDAKDGEAEKKAKIKRLNIDALVSTLFEAFRRENYPYMRDENIERVLRNFMYDNPTNYDPNFIEYNRVWELTVADGTDGAKAGKVAGAKAGAKVGADVGAIAGATKGEVAGGAAGAKAGKVAGAIFGAIAGIDAGIKNKNQGGHRRAELFAIELKRALTERRFFHKVIDDAVSKRSSLFASSGPSLSARNNALGVLNAFVDKNLTNVKDDKYNFVYEGEQSLWRFFLDENKGYFKKTGGGDLVGSELVDFGNLLRAELKPLLKDDADLNAVFTTVLKNHKQNIEPKTGEAMLKEAELGNWTAAVNKNQPVIDAFSNLKNSGVFMQSKSASFVEIKKAHDDALTEYRNSGMEAIVATKQAIRLTTSLYPTAIENLEDLYKNITFENLDLTTDVKPTSDHKEKIITWVRAVHNELDSVLNLKDQPIVWDSKHWSGVSDKLTDLVILVTPADTALNKDYFNGTFKEAVDKFADVADPEMMLNKDEIEDFKTAATDLENAKLNFTINFNNINSKSGYLKTELVKFIKAAKATKPYNKKSDLRDIVDRINENVNTLIITLSKSAEQKATGITGYVQGNDVNFKNKFSKFKTKMGEYKSKKAIFDEEKTNINEVKKVYTNYVTALVDAIKAAMISYRKTFSAEKNPSDNEFNGLRDAVAVRVEGKLKSGIKKDEKENLKLADVVTHAFTGQSILPDTTTERSVLAGKFAKRFKGYASLIHTDEPVLVAVMKSGKVKFNNPKLAPKAIAAVSGGLAKLSNPKKKKTDLKKDLEAVMSVAGTAILFGTNSANPAVIEAFKDGFYHAFKHRLDEAVSAETVASYDYWWLTFYPKAVPFGNNKVAGQSIIEVNFKENLYPKDMYHRWLLDRPIYKSGGRRGANGLIRMSENEKDKASVAEYKSKILRATSIINSTRTVLHRSGSSENFSGMLATLGDALIKFAGEPNSTLTPKQRYYSGIANLYYVAVAKEIDRLNEQLDENIKSIEEKPDRIEELTREKKRLERKIKRINKEAEHNIQLKWLDEQLGKIAISIEEEPLRIKDFTQEKEDFTRKKEALKKRVESINEEVKYKMELERQKTWLEGKIESINEDAGRKKELERQTGDIAKEKISIDIRINRLENELLTVKDVVAKIIENSEKGDDNQVSILEVIKGNPNKEYCKNSYTWSQMGADPIDDFLFGLGSALGFAEKCPEKGLPLPENLDLYRNAFGWEHFDMRHVFFAVVMATQRHEALPQKVELLSNVFFSGSRRFTESPLPGEKQLESRYAPDFARKLDRRYVSTFYERKAAIEMERYLILKGVSESSFDRLKENIYKDSLPWGKTTKEGRNYVSWTKEKFKEFVDKDQKKRREISQDLMRGVEYRVGAKKSKYLAYPELWPLERRLDHAREELRQIIVDSFYGAYPDVPDQEEIKKKFVSKSNHMETLAYEWLRDTWLRAEENKGIFGQSSDDTPLVCSKLKTYMGLSENYDCDEDSTLQVCKRFNACKKRETDIAKRVLIRELLDKQPYLTVNSQNYLMDEMLKGNKGNKDNKGNTWNIYSWINAILRNQLIVDQLSANLLDYLYMDLFNVIAELGKVEVDMVPYKEIQSDDYESFKSARYEPRTQKGITIMDMLPSSRDDLVAKSIHEGGAVAKIAGKAEGAATYDTNSLQTAMRYAESRNQIARTARGTDSASQVGSLEGLTESFSDRVTNTRQNSFEEMLDMSQGGRLGGYSLGGSARGDVYARARAAYAYSKRREYLDAAITAAGRGDSFAKWVVRRGDVRSDLSTSDNERQNAAAAHNGFPNGDQPFNLLVKVPHGSVQTAWDGSRYIFFNSSYTAMKQASWWKDIGTLTFLYKAPIVVLNPNWIWSVEQEPLGTTFPFKWDVSDWRGQIALLNDPNILGGRIKLDSTDKIKYSEISAMVEGEKNIVKLTRQLQTGEVDKVMEELDAEAKDPKFREDTRKRILDSIDTVNST